MSTGLNRHGITSPARPAGRNAPGFTLIELIVVIIVLGILAALAIPRYAGLVDQASQGAAQGALAEGYNRLTAATARYIADNRGAVPQSLADLSPDYMNATDSLGDYTAVLVQGSGQVTVQVFPGAASTGTPLASRSVNWP